MPDNKRAVGTSSGWGWVGHRWRAPGRWLVHGGQLATCEQGDRQPCLVLVLQPRGGCWHIHTVYSDLGRLLFVLYPALLLPPHHGEHDCIHVHVLSPWVRSTTSPAPPLLMHTPCRARRCRLPVATCNRRRSRTPPPTRRRPSRTCRRSPPLPTNCGRSSATAARPAATCRPRRCRCSPCSRPRNRRPAPSRPRRPAVHPHLRLHPPPPPAGSLAPQPLSDPLTAHASSRHRQGKRGPTSSPTAPHHQCPARAAGAA